MHAKCKSSNCWFRSNRVVDWPYRGITHFGRAKVTCQLKRILKCVQTIWKMNFSFQSSSRNCGWFSGQLLVQWQWYIKWGELSIMMWPNLTQLDSKSYVKKDLTMYFYKMDNFMLLSVCLILSWEIRACRFAFKQILKATLLVPYRVLTFSFIQKYTAP